MQLRGRDAAAFLRKPDPGAAGLLISGEDAMRVAEARARVTLAMTGPEGEAEMRLTRIAGADLRRDPALLSDATRATGFFPGPRAVVVEDATDSLVEPIRDVLNDWKAGDARIVVTAGTLTPRSALRKLFEGARGAYAITLYDEPPGPEEIAALLAAAGLTRVGSGARRDLADLAQMLDPGDFRQTVEKLGLYMHGAPGEVTPEDVAACAPASYEADVDTLCDVVLDRDEGRLADLLRRLLAQGTTPVAIVIALGRRVRQLHQMAADPAGPAGAAQRMGFRGGFRRRDLMVRQAGQWGTGALGTALGLVVDCDLQLRSADTAPQQALVERLLIRLARMRR
ncbi:MAG: DNA polymerase III subunit delta [Rubellimicrobium sp.]|nr:DNA polymerase III subunit delta [Rubellimicrobium sp.]